MVDQGGHGVEESCPVQPCHRRSRSDVKAAGESSQLHEDLPGPIAEQLKAPVDGAAERLLARRTVSVSVAEQLETIGEPLEDFAERQQPQACGGQLDGQRDTVERATELSHLLRVVGAKPKFGAHGPGSLNKHLGGGCRGDVLDLARLGQSEGRQRKKMLALKLQGRATRDQEGQTGNGLEQFGEARAPRQQLLEVVEHDQRALLGRAARREVLAQARQQPLFAEVGQAQGLGQLGQDLVGVGQRTQLGPGHRLAGPLGKVFGDLERNPGFSDSARPAHSNQTRSAGLEQTLKALDLGFAADQRGRRQGQRDGHLKPGRNVDKSRRHRKLTRENGHQRLHAPGFGGIMPGQDHSQPGLSSSVKERMIGLSGQQNLGILGQRLSHHSG